MTIGKHVYSASSDGEDSECSVDALNKISDWKIWKLAVERDMGELRERVLKLELQNNDGFPKKVQSLKDQESFATAEDDGFCGLFTCFHLIRTRKASLLQCIWLSFFIIFLTTYGTIEFLRARANTQAEFKPEKKQRTVNYYETRDSNLIYEMPYIYFWFFGGHTNKSYQPNVNETLLRLLESQNYFVNSTNIGYLNGEADDLKTYLPLPIEEAKAFYPPRGVTDEMFTGCFRLKLKNPDPSRGYFQFMVSINIQKLTLNGTMWLDGFWVAVAREMTDTYWGELVYVPIEDALSKGSNINSHIDFDEKVTHRYQSDDVHSFSSSLAWYEEEWDSDETGKLAIMFRANLMIEHWGEYVDFGYLDWFSSVGGMISVSSIFFIWGAYFLAVMFGDKNRMGILPEISFVFSNFETVHLLKQHARIE